eukprot:12072484-Alexandrium_andersonii.AAC.1
MGEQRQAILKNAVVPDGTVDWLKATAYTFEWSKPGEGEVARIVGLKHISGVQATVARVNITQDLT